MFSVKVEGDEEFIRTLLRVEKNMGRRYLNPGFTKAARLVVNSARSLAPKDTGRMRKGITSRALKRSRVVFGRIVMLPTREDLGIPETGGYYPMSIETGWTDPRTGERHAARPFMRPAIQRNRSRLLKIVTDTARERMRRDVKR